MILYHALVFKTVQVMKPGENRLYFQKHLRTVRRLLRTIFSCQNGQKKRSLLPTFKIIGDLPTYLISSDHPWIIQNVYLNCKILT